MRLCLYYVVGFTCALSAGVYAQAGVQQAQSITGA